MEQLAQTEAELLDNPIAGRPTLILRSPDFHSITEVVAEPVERRTPIGWWLFSAILFLFRQKWRTSINRAAEAMTIFAVMCALTFPGIHVGRVWVAYWMFPIPNQMGMWPNFRSPLLWDVFAVSIYGTVSVLFWYVGLIPDVATIRDRAKTPIRRFAYGL